MVCRRSVCAVMAFEKIFQHDAGKPMGKRGHQRACPQFFKNTPQAIPAAQACAGRKHDENRDCDPPLHPCDGPRFCAGQQPAFPVMFGREQLAEYQCCEQKDEKCRRRDQKKPDDDCENGFHFRHIGLRPQNFNNHLVFKDQEAA